MAWQPAETRYDDMRYNRCGRSGLKLPALSLGLWHNFGEDARMEVKRAICRTAFDLGVTHFDLANNYGPPPGSAEIAFGEILRTDFAGHRDELVISTKAGYNMWPGPYGEWGSRKYVLSSLDQSLKRMGVDYVDIFYSHRFDPDTPLEETMMALDQAVRAGKALYVGISSYNARRTREAAAILAELGTPCLIHQPSYSMLNRWVEEDGLLDALDDLGVGSIVFSPLAQGMLTTKYLDGVPADSRAAQGKSLREGFLSEEALSNIRALNAIAARRGQTLAQMAIAWVLRGGRVTSALIGASRPEQVEDCVGALDNADFTAEELAEIDRYARDAGINLWAKSAERDGPERKPAASTTPAPAASAPKRRKAALPAVPAMQAEPLPPRDIHVIEARGIRVGIDLSVGHLTELTVERDGMVSSPLHAAPWLGEAEEALPSGLPHGQARLSGDFLCAPFGRSDVEGAPIHGWPANSPWDHIETAKMDDGVRATFRLRRKVMGADVTKTLILRDDHPFLYQDHIFTGGSGKLPVAHHTMTAMAEGGILSFSPKRFAFTPPTALETDPALGRSHLRYPYESSHLATMLSRDERDVDLHQFPIAERSEDFVVLVERYHSGLGWAAVSRRAEKDIVLTLKSRGQFPVTMLWMSNGGRDYAPWNGRHAGVIGIEDGRTDPGGHRASLAKNRLTSEEMETSFDLDAGPLSIRHVIGAIPTGFEASAVEEVLENAGVVTVSLANGAVATFHFDDQFLFRAV